MHIGQAAAACGLSARMIRHYEAIHLIAPGSRNNAGYRIYSEQDIHTLCFIKRTRSLGFSLEQTRSLLSLWQDECRASADVKSIASAHVAELDKRIAELTEMRNTLDELIRSCNGDTRAECPILRNLEAASPVTRTQKPDTRK